jgi:hypothetical protein
MFFNGNLFIQLEWKNGMLEYWNTGILGVRAEINHFNCKKLLQTHHFYPVKLFSISPGPLLHYSTIPIGPARSCLAMAGGAKLLST